MTREQRVTPLENKVAELKRQLDDRPKFIVCPHCGANVPAGNFCGQCAHKMVETCDCWRLNRKFDCGFEYCPTMGALIKKFGNTLGGGEKDETL